MPAPAIKVSLRTKLALLALTLLALPWAGILYVREMERLLLTGQEQALIATSRAVATVLHDRPGLLELAPPRDSQLRREAEEELRRLGAGRPGAKPRPRGVPPESPPPRPVVPDGDGAAAEPAPTGEGEAQTDTASAAPEPVGTGNTEILAILRGLERSASRIWVVTRDYRVLALAGSLKQPPSADDRGWRLAMQRSLAWLITMPNREFDDALSDDVLITERQISAALQGAAGTRARKTPDGRAVIVSAAHPIWSEDRVVGAVVVEETTNRILSLRSRAMERLLLVTLTVFALAAAVLMWFATRLSSRIRRLRDETESAIDARGRVVVGGASGNAPGTATQPGGAVITQVSGTDSGDEIGDLSRSFSAMLQRLSQHTAYLESMASRLSHELRTPIAVVRSSLENLKLRDLPADARIYVERADEGVSRLSTLITRMSEASHLEQGLAEAERERFDLARVVAGCVQGYRIAYPGREFSYQGPEGTAAGVLTIDGAPDLIAQMLDKLIVNAADFADPGTPIRIRLEQQGEQALIVVANNGPLLPDEIRGRLFESMVSVRYGPTDGTPHLGLGLYIVRLIAGFHGGSASADNNETGDGVTFSVRLRI